MKLITKFSLLIIALCVACNSDTKEKTMESDSAIKVIAHRGGAKLAPENTLAAFKKAMALGVDMIEIDVILSKDGEVIVIHDNTIDRTTNGKGVVKEMNLAEIKNYDAGSWFDNKYAREKVPTLDEVFETINGQCTLLIEIKDGDEVFPGLEKKVVEAVHKYKANDWVVIQSFNENTVLRVKQMDASLTTYYLLGGNFKDFYSEIDKLDKTTDKKYDGIAVSKSQINADNTTAIKKTGYKLFVWTVNDPEAMKVFIEYGVDGIITDSPDKLIEMLK